MRLLHISDLHIGKRVNGISMVEDQRHILDQIIEITIEEDVDALLIAGDIYDKASPSAEAVMVFDGFLAKLAAKDISVIAIPGNHDSSERIAFAHSLLGAQGVWFPPVFEGEVSHFELADEHGKVTFWLLPFLKPGDVRRFFPDSEIGDDYSAALEAVIEACEIDVGARNVALSHQFVTAKGASTERADDEIQLGGIDNVDASIYDEFDYVALGHVHRAQRIGRDTVRYSGAPLKYSLSEARYSKSAVLVTLGAKQEGAKAGECVDTSLVQLEALRDMREVRSSFDELMAAAEHLEEPCRDYVYFTLTDERQQPDAMRRLREFYPNAMALDYDNIAVSVTGESASEPVDPDQMDTAELFERFYEEQTGKELDDGQRAIVNRAIADALEERARGMEQAEGDGA